MNLDEYPEIVVKYPEISISGNSVPENAEECWYPFITRLEVIAMNWDQLTINFKFDYYNTRTKRYLTRIFYILEAMATRAEVIVNWYYLTDDTDMEEIGTDYQETMKINIRMFERK
jgi:hypothetical protein